MTPFASPIRTRRERSCAPRRTGSRGLVFAGLALLGCIGTTACSNRADDSTMTAAGAGAGDSPLFGGDTSTDAGLQLGDTVTDVTFRTIDGGAPRLSDFHGPVLINFWATSCAVCLAEAPELVALHDRLATRGYRMVSVAMPYDRPDAVLELVQANGWTQPVAIDLDGAVLAAFEPVLGTPTNLLIAPDGTLAERYLGRTDIASLQRRVLDLLAGS